jgi:protein required for attachment to host cells
MNDAAPASTIQSSAGGFSGREIAIGEIRSPRSVINGVYQLPNFKEINMLLPHGTVLAVIDGRHFELHRNSGNEADPVLSDMASPKLDEHNKGAGTRHHSSSANPTGHLADEDAHVAAVAEWLNGQVQGGKIAHLVVIAPPKALGELRRHYGSHLEGALLKEIAKDLAGRSGKDVLETVQAA